MAQSTLNQSEIEILTLLWEQNDSTVREIHEEILKRREVGYTTTLKQVQRMHEKGLIKRTNKTGRSHVYRAVVKADKQRKLLVKQLVNSAFDGSTGQLVLHALGGKRPDSDEIAEIRKLLDQMDGQ
ncbi:MAG: BlaI/MecI/CopY family transcriptional regulator [Pseudomonadota bacterium]